MSAKPKRSFGGPKHPVALGILVVVAVGLIVGNVALVNASNAYVPWSEVEATVVGGPIAPEAFLTTATVYLDDENGTAYYEDVFERSDTQCSTYTDEYGDTYEDCWTDYWTEYECYADLDLRWTVNGTEHQAWEYSPTLYIDQPCLRAIEATFPNGTNLTILVDPNDPTSYQAFDLALMTEVDEDHPGFRTGYRESSYLEWGGYGRVVLVTSCGMDAAVAYTFDGKEYVRDIWGGSPVMDAWDSSCLVEYIETFGPGTTMMVMVDSENPSEVAWEDPTTDPGEFIGTALCCSVIIFLVAFVLTGKGGTSQPRVMMGRHGHYGHHYGNRHHRHHHSTRSHHRGGSNRRVRVGGRSSGGGGRGRSGGGSRGGGGGRSRSGGGGGRSGGGGRGRR